MAEPLPNRVALVTGAGRGLGRATALALAEQGARVIVNDLGVTPDGRSHDGDPATDVASEIVALGGEAIANQDTVATFDGASRAVGSAIEHFGRLDILVNNAGIIRPAAKDLFTAEFEDYQDMVDVHLNGTFYTCRVAAPMMVREGWGRIVNTASHAAFGYVERNTIYAAVKAATISLTYGMARELLGTGVTVNCVNNAGQSRLWEAARKHFERSLTEGLISEATFAEFLSMPPAEYAAAVTAYLATDKAGDITGELIGCGQRLSVFWHPHEVDRFQHDPNEGPLPFERVAEILPAMIALAEQRAPSYVRRIQPYSDPSRRRS